MAALENGGAYARAKIPEFSLAIQGYDESSEAFVSNLLQSLHVGLYRKDAMEQTK